MTSCSVLQLQEETVTTGYKSMNTREEALDFVAQLSEFMGFIVDAWDLPYETEPYYIIKRSIEGCVIDALLESGLVNKCSTEEASEFWDIFKRLLINNEYLCEAE